MHRLTDRYIGELFHKTLARPGSTHHDDHAYPASVNVWDSLGDAYVAAGRRREAIEAYEKAALMDPDGSLGGSASRKAAELREDS